MGQILKLIADQLVCFDYNYINYNQLNHNNDNNNGDSGLNEANGRSYLVVSARFIVCFQGLPDLSEWPPELSLTVLRNLNATDLCLAACVWTELARDQVLWHSLACSQWGYASIYLKPKTDNFSYHKLYLQLDEGSVTFNADSQMVSIAVS